MAAGGAALVASLVGRLSYRDGWQFKMGGPGGSVLCVYAHTVDSQARHQRRFTQHQFPAPDGLGDEHAAARWIFDRLLLVERHEAGEFFAVDGRFPFFPHHQDEGSPHELVDRWDDLTWP